MFKVLAFIVAASSLVSAFNVPAQSARSSSALSARSKSVPFLDQPVALSGKLPGDVGFDPLGLSNIFDKKDWSENVVPDLWPEDRKVKISTIDWMREAEVKHARICMLAVLGWVAVDLGARFPGAPDVYTSIPSSLAAHKLAVDNGSLGVLLLIVSLLELANGAAIYDQARGSGRLPGDFSFDPLGFGKDARSRERYATNEIKNGRLAMLAFSGLVTQAALFPDQTFPYF